MKRRKKNGKKKLKDEKIKKRDRQKEGQDAVRCRRQVETLYTFTSYKTAWSGRD